MALVQHLEVLSVFIPHGNSLIFSGATGGSGVAVISPGATDQQSFTLTHGTRSVITPNGADRVCRLTSTGGVLEYSFSPTKDLPSYVTSDDRELSPVSVSTSGDMLGPDGVIGGSSAFGSAVRAYRAGLRARPPLIFGIGDSNFTGEGAGSGSGTVAKLTAAADKGPIDQILSVLPSLSGLTLSRAGFFGESNITANSAPLTEYDPRLSIGTGWSIDGSATYIGGRFFAAAAASAGVLEFRSGVTGADTVEVHYPTKLSGTFSADCGIYASDGTKIGSFATLTGQTDSVAVATVTSSKFADGIVRLKEDGGTGVARVGGMLVYKAGSPTIMVARGSNSGATAATFASTATAVAGMGQIDTIKPDLTIIALTINDINAATATGTFNTNLAAVVAKALRWGDVIVATGQPGGGSNYVSANTWADIELECRKVAGAYGCRFVSMHKELGSYAAQNSAGNTYDTSHMKASGYLLQSRVFARQIAALASL